MARKKQPAAVLPREMHCTFDGAANPNPGNIGMGWTIDSETGNDAVLGQRRTNNEAEYGALIRLLRRVSELVKPGDHVHICGDSQLVIEQMTEGYAVRSYSLSVLWEKARTLVDRLQASSVTVSLTWHPREDNQAADELSTQALRDAGVAVPTAADLRPQPGYGTLTECGKAAGISAVMAGRVLDNLGYRDRRNPTQRAWDEGVAALHYLNPWTLYPVVDWHMERVAALVRSHPEATAKLPRTPRPRMVRLDGNTYPHGKAIRAAGGRWRPQHRAWYVPQTVYTQLKTLVTGVGHEDERTDH